MKKVLLMMIGSMLLLQTAFADNDVVTTDTNRLPVSSREFIRKHFQGASISHIKIESNLFGITSYDVILTNGFDLEFNKQGAWTEVDGERVVVPTAIVPKAITDYQVKHFPKQQIVSISLDERGYEVKLNEGLEMQFDKKCKFIRYDD